MRVFDVIFQKNPEVTYSLYTIATVFEVRPILWAKERRTYWNESSFPVREDELIIVEVKIVPRRGRVSRKFLDKLRLAGIKLPDPEKQRNSFWTTVKLLWLLEKKPELKEKLLQQPQPTVNINELKEKLRLLSVQQLRELCDYIQQLIEVKEAEGAERLA